MDLFKKKFSSSFCEFERMINFVSPSQELHNFFIGTTLMFEIFFLFQILKIEEYITTKETRDRERGETHVRANPNNEVKRVEHKTIMSDPDGMERYCSSYYDKHGLYNDGFPCPGNKYCCQAPDGGSKMCCSVQESVAGKSKNANINNNNEDYSSNDIESSLVGAVKKESAFFNKFNTKSPPNIRTTISNLNNFLLEQKHLSQNSNVNLNNNNHKNSQQFNSIVNSNKQSFISSVKGNVGAGFVGPNSPKSPFITDMSSQSSINSYSSFTTLPFFITK